MDMFSTVCIACVLAAATATDLRGQKIPNVLTFPAIVAGIAFHGLTQGLDGLAFSAAGLGLGLAVMLLPYLAGVMGAGDVKLMAAVGAWLGSSVTFEAFLLSSLAGGVYALVVLFLFHRDVLRRVLAAFWSTLVIFAATRRLSFAAPAADRRLPRLCYGLAIAIGTLTAMTLRHTIPGGLFAGM